MGFRYLGDRRWFWIVLWNTIKNWSSLLRALKKLDNVMTRGFYL